ncbi:transcriptional corepressor SEUSS-like isoform X1 [Cucurbita moschata]|uniref:Transcriptional corepressor SEUSS-like isoform X1 n=1 Tax=Cucurbita moschata TaxID=3662 RepID=A0A6J1GXI7_CUCMO|nr:transcriptional corepressor SEUSS-like isoform X1 [Cucurbita moschata]XP_022955887.1 transcriptional corepressor SEUSS-like isoform X1 [Cucurbita moschata]XP_022955895.1 transcriptional corepressor SEUSS-like isoform X1 [Cucurbita moschata]XP_022955903.1 transcriptional corepressor SEUSS-like isoform X1 [Cucurbita moschata]XP_022955911.1 transcriptional corepressor SEUSS-like isoform X1 [Cucurbita moschata]XP_022955920.1 transcriptional corepressor SEUSS-like isoform X1 [Cucurbita moschata]
MVTTGPPTPMGGGAQSVSPSLLRSDSGLLGVQGGLLPSQAFSSLVSPRNQFNSMNMLGNMSNVSSLLNQSFGNGAPNSGLPCPGGVDTGAEPDPLSGVGNGMNFNNPSSSFVASIMTNPVSFVQGQNPQFSNLSSSQLLSDQQQSQQLEPQNFHQSQQSMEQFSALQSNQQSQFQAIRGLTGVGPVKLEPQVTGRDQHGQQQQHLQTLRNLGSVKLESQRLHSMRGLAPVKMEPQQSDQSLFLQQQQHQQHQHSHQHQHQQQQQFLHMSRQSSQAAAAQINLMHQQRLLQLQQQHQQQHLLKSMPPQRPQLQQHLQQQNLPQRSPVKPGYEPGMCARRLTYYMYHQQNRPEDNNIDFWRKFVNEYFAPHAKKKWCVSMYGCGRQTTGVFPQDAWHCEICKRKPGRGFEATAEVLPRLFKIKYESGTMEELLYLDMPREYHNASGEIVLDYAKAIQESVFEQLRVVRDGQLRIVFSPDLKICSWEFCARRHEELIPRRLLIPQVSHLGAAAQKYQSAIQSASSNLSTPELQNNCNMFVASARQLAKALEVPLVNDLGYTKRYVRCLQISEVVNSMKDLIDYSKETGIGPMDSLAKFPRRSSSSSGLTTQAQGSDEQQQQQQQQSSIAQRPNNNQSFVQASAVQISASNGVTSVNSNANQPSTSNSASTIVGLLHQNSMNSRQQNTMAKPSNSNGGSSVQIPSPGSSSTIPPTQPNPSTFQPPTPSSSNNPSQPPHTAAKSSNQMSTANSPANISMQQSALSGDADPSDTQSSVQKILQEMMMNNQMNGSSSLVGMGSVVNDMKNVNGILPTGNTGLNNGGNCIGGNGTTNGGLGMGGGYGSMGSGLGQPAMVNGMRNAMGNNSIMNRRIGMASLALEQSMNGQQQDLGNHLLSGLGAVNGLSNLQYDWKPFP